MMKFLFFATLIVLASARTPTELGSGLCDFLQDVEAFIKPGILDWFDNQCVPQIAAQVDACHGELQKAVKEMAKEICDEVSTEVESIAKKLPKFLQNVLDPLFAPDGPFDTQCDIDFSAYLLKQVQQQCAQIGQLDPKKVCDEAFTEIWSELTSALNDKFCSS